MAALRELRDAAIARRLTVQNKITREYLTPRETVKQTLGKISAAWRGSIQEHSYSSAPLILAELAITDPEADSWLRDLLDAETYSTAGRINRAMEKWICSQEITNAE
jgi:hypothetical protein